MASFTLVRSTCNAERTDVAQMAGPLCEKARDLGLIVITAGKGDVVRLVPPLIVTEAEIDQAIATLVEAAKTALV